MNDKTVLTAQAAAALLIDSEPWLSCDDCFDQADAAVERLLADDTELDDPFRVHLVACGVCLEEARSLATLIAPELGLTEAEADEKITAALTAQR